MSSFVGVLVSDQWLQSQFTQVELRTLKSKVSFFFFFYDFNLILLFSWSLMRISMNLNDDGMCLFCDTCSMFLKELNRVVLLWEICLPFSRNWRLFRSFLQRMRLRLYWKSHIRIWMMKLILSPSLGWALFLFFVALFSFSRFLYNYSVRIRMFPDFVEEIVR